jgi:lipopolysaccharide biosynthesis glycosyltransferase
MNIERVYIACHKKDFWQTRICVASIRYWYPEFPISLIKDLSSGEFSTKEMEISCNVEIADFQYTKFGWGVSKFEPLFIENKSRIMIIDSDIVFLGRVIDYLNDYVEDFVIDDANTNYFRKTYYDLNKINKDLNPDFIFPGFAFNTGQFLCTTGLVKRTDFEDFVEWRENKVPILKKSQIFACADQGILNYFLQQRAQKFCLSLGRAKFMIWGNSEEVFEIKLEKILSKEGYPKLIHWAGGFKSFEKINRIDIVLFFQKQYYSNISLGEFRRNIFNFNHTLYFFVKGFRKNYGVLTGIKRILKLN